MSTASPASSDDKDPVLAIIAKIKDKTLEPRTLSPDDRRRCVEMLYGEGYSTAEMAQILKRDERTIKRDIAAVRAANAFTPTAAFGEQMTGELLRQAEISTARLRRIARESGVSGMERLMAEAAAWKVFKEMIEKLQSLGHLPRVPTSVITTVYQQHDADPIASYDELAQRMEELKRVSRELGGNDPNRLSALEELSDRVERSRLSVQIDRLRHDESSGQGGPEHESN